MGPPAAGHVSHLGRGREARLHDQVERLLIGELLVFLDDATLDGLLDQLVSIKARAVVSDLDIDAATFVEGS